MKQWIVEFEENGPEYYVGILTITANNVTRTSSTNVIVADGVSIKVDEPIISIIEKTSLPCGCGSKELHEAELALSGTC